LKATFSTFNLIHVPREQNSRANIFSKLASSRKGGYQKLLIHETLNSPKITKEGLTEVSHVEVLWVSSGKGKRSRSMIQEILKVLRITTYGSLGDESLEVLHVDTIETWLIPYKRYLVDGLLLVEPVEAKMVKRNAGWYTLIDGNIFHHGYSHPILTCVSGDQCIRIMTEFHEGICGSHIQRRVLSLKVIRAGYYWLIMKEDCTKYVQRCEECQKHIDWCHT